METVSVDHPEPGAGMAEGLKLADAPEGSPEADSEMLELKAPESVVVMFAEVELPCTTDKLDADELIAKSFVGEKMISMIG